MRPTMFLTAMLLGSAIVPPAYAQQEIILRDSFPIGDSNGLLCQVQDRSLSNPAKQSPFDRKWAVVCRDSARAVGTVHAFRGSQGDPLALASVSREEKIACTGSQPLADSPLSGLTREQCTIDGTQLGYSVFRVTRGSFSYIAEGYSPYDDATLLALQSLVTNAPVTGTINAASTSIADPTAFARVQALTLEPEQALAEGYRRNMAGDYAEAAEYFETLQQRLSGDASASINPGEYLVNRALQKSNLGEFAEADRLLDEARPLVAGDGMASRLLRNYEAIHLINQGRYGDAVTRLDSVGADDIVTGSATLTRTVEITTPIASRLNGSNRSGNLLGFIDELKLTDQERNTIIDAQALQLRGTALRILGQNDAARNALLDGYQQALSVRDGRVTSVTRLRSQILGELALIAEQTGSNSDAELYLRRGLDVLETQYPETRAVNGTKAKLAALLLRQDRTDEAVGLYREVIAAAVRTRSAATGFSNQLAPYFQAIVESVAQDPAAAEDFFQASQLLVRPGVAETQAILARQLSAGSDEAARLFRQSTDLTRTIEQRRIAFLALGRAEQSAAVQQRRGELAAEIADLERDQQQTQLQLNAYPQYRVVANQPLSLSALRSVLKGGEAYARLLVVGEDIFLFFTDRTRANAYRLPINAATLDRRVDTLRATISLLEDGRRVTYPFDIETAHTLFAEMFAPVAGQIEGIDHLIFEPDGAMLRLPINLLVRDDASVKRYLERIERPAGDSFDFTEVNWLGLGMDVSTAVSARAFVDARNVAASRAPRDYLGMGRNVPLDPANIRPDIQATLVSGSNACGWSISEWARPIADNELKNASQLIGAQTSTLITGTDFTDQQILNNRSIGDYRILHFATHGLVTPPNPQCPARPALLTSFGEPGSDGLLSFDEIFDLELNADIVILSACDTAGKASVSVTREAGVSSGGGTALDGLVRSFIGAGGRSVLASHWPAPDEFRATERLINGLFERGRGSSIGSALRQSQEELMREPATSHPFYWSGFALVGDGARELLGASSANVAATLNNAGGKGTAAD